MNLTIEDISDAVIAAFPKLTRPEQRVSLATYRLLARGRPVAPMLIAAESGLPDAAVTRMLDGWHGVERDNTGAVTAFWGLTLTTTKHRFQVPGTTIFTWCAWDTLFLPELLGAVADVESICPATRTTIALRVAPGGILSGTPQAAALSFVLPNEADIERSITETFCCHVNFFASAQAGEQWAAAHPGAFILSLEDAWQIGARRNAAQFGSVLCS
ncbi:MAG: organomercurial lyase [Betaproteobacteria bacterium]